MEGKKYKLTDKTIVMYGNTTLHRIQASKDFGDVKKGDLGGFVESEDNLSHYGTCWIYDNAKVYGNARVFDDAQIFGKAQVYGDALVNGTSQVFGTALVFDNAKVYGNAKIFGNAWVYDNVKVFGDAKVFGNAWVYDNVKVYGNAEVYGDAKVCGHAEVTSVSDYIVFKNWWSSKRYFTWTRSNDMWACGCFHGTGKELIEKAYKDSEVSGREYERVVNYVESIKSEINKIEETETHNHEEEKKTADL